MPNCGRRTFRSRGPCWCNVNRSRNKAIAFRLDTCPIGEQLLLTLVQSLPDCGMNAAWSRSFTPSPFRRRIRKNCGRSQTITFNKKPLTLQVGMPVRQVSGQDRLCPRAAEEGFIRQRKELSMAKAKAREKEYERIPKLKVDRKKECLMSQLKAREEEYERIPKMREGKKRLSAMAQAKAREEEYERIPRIKGGRKPDDPRGSRELSIHSIPEIPQKQQMRTSDKIYPCFRGEYPTRHCKDSYLWFEAGGPNCGKLVTICDGGQQMLGQAEILTACEVTESHYLAMDDENADDLPTVSPCKKCRPVIYGYPMQQQQQQQQEQQLEQDSNCFGSFRQNQYPCRHQQVSCRQQHLPCRQKPLPCRQQQLPYRQQPVPSRQQQQLASMDYSSSSAGRDRSSVGQNRSPVGQQRLSVGQQRSSNGQQRSSVGQQQSSFLQSTRPCTKRSNCRQQSPHKVCWKCQDQQQLALQMQNQVMSQQQEQQQESIQCNNYGLNEMLAEELKQQMQEAQAQIAKVQLQLNSVCVCNSANNYMPQYMMEQDGDEIFENNDHEILEEPTQQLQEQRMSSRSGMGQQQIQFGYCPVPVSMPNQNPCYQEQAMPLRMTFSCQQLAPCQQQLPPCQQQAPSTQQQVSTCQQQLPPCQQQLPPCQQQQQCCKLLCQEQEQSSYPCQQNQIPNSSQPNMFPKHAPHCCPSCYFPRYAQMRFMMPRGWPR
ncbi:hypothetical protein KR032_009190 [Drosophila birchii]|nr:hypothetical protein KR032_009190 [Drosophila birchii]